MRITFISIIADTASALDKSAILSLFGTMYRA
jgi:hypothetical protein